MRSNIRSQIFILALLAVWASWARAQTAVDITAEPHHRLLLQNDQVRVFAFTLKPSEQAYVKQEHNFLMITLDDCEIVMWSEGESAIANYIFKAGDTHFLYNGKPRGFRNDRTTACRNVVVEFLDPKVTAFGYDPGTGNWDYGPNAVSNAVDPRAKYTNTLALGPASVLYTQLLAGDAFSAPDKGVAELLIPVTDVDFKTQGDVHMRKSPGDVVWLGTSRKSDLTNAAGGPLRFVMVQFKAPPGS